MLKAASLTTALLCAVAGVSAQRSVSTPRPDLVGRAFDARVVRIADGDTVDAVPAGELRPIRLRLQGVDAPELGEVFSTEAQTFLRTLIFDQRVHVDGGDVDRYGRLVARITIGGKDASVELLRMGLACHAYTRDATLATEESAARKSGRGFWAAAAKKPECVARQSPAASRPVPPAKTPPAQTPRVAAGYRGNVSSGIYHATWCPNFNCRNCTRVFSTEAEAKAAGFRPAADCAR